MSNADNGDKNDRQPARVIQMTPRQLASHVGATQGMAGLPVPLRHQIMREHKDWKDTLCRMIKNKSEVVFHPDGGYSFLLPPALVKLVWQTTIKERVALEKAKGKDEKQAWLDAMAGLRSEVEQGIDRLKEQTKPQPTEQEEADAKAELEKMRAELIKSKE